MRGQDIYSKFFDYIQREFSDESITVFAVTSDTTGNMNVFGKHIEDQGIYHCYCTDHLLHLTASNCFSGSTEIASIKKFSKLTSSFNYSTQLLETLMEAQKSSDHYVSIPKRPITDVQTHWWSTHMML